MPYTGAGDASLPDHVKHLSEAKRRQWVAVWTSVYADTQDEGRAFAAANAAVKKADEDVGVRKDEGMTQEWKATVPLFKARKDEGGKMFVSILASSTTLDKHEERVAPAFIASMKAQAAAGEVEFTETHDSAIPLGVSVGSVDPVSVWEEVKGKVKCETPEELFVPEFELDATHPLAVKVFEDVSSGRCRWQASIGGQASARKIFDPESKRVIRLLEDGKIDHVALTRAGRAANPDAQFLSAVMKAEFWAGIPDPEPEVKPAEDAAEPNAADAPAAGADEVRAALRAAERAREAVAAIIVVGTESKPEDTPVEESVAVSAAGENAIAKLAAAVDALPERLAALLAKPVEEKPAEDEVEKAGRVLSGKNRTALAAALEGMTGAMVALQQLLESSGLQAEAAGEAEAEAEVAETAKTAQTGLTTEEVEVSKQREGELRKEVGDLKARLEVLEKQPAADAQLPVRSVEKTFAANSEEAGGESDITKIAKDPNLTQAQKMQAIGRVIAGPMVKEIAESFVAPG
jgi:hypothetical protein